MISITLRTAQRCYSSGTRLFNNQNYQVAQKKAKEFWGSYEVWLTNDQFNIDAVEEDLKRIRRFQFLTRVKKGLSKTIDIVSLSCFHLQEWQDQRKKCVNFMILSIMST